MKQERARTGTTAALGRGATLRTHDFECVGKGGKEGGGGKADAAVAAADVPVAPKLDLMRMRARAAGEGGSVTDRVMNRVFQVTPPCARDCAAFDSLTPPAAAGIVTRRAAQPEGGGGKTVRWRAIC